MVRKLAQRHVQRNRNSSSEDTELSEFLDQLDGRIKEEIKRADRLLKKLKISDTPPDGGRPDVGGLPVCRNVRTD